MKFKLLIAFERMSFTKLMAKAQCIKVALNSEPALTVLPDPWPSSYPSRAEITQAYMEYETAYDAAGDAGKAARHDRDQKWAVLVRKLKDAAPYFESVAKATNDQTILTATGYDLQRPNEPVPQPLPAPEFKIQRNGVSGVLIGRAKGIYRAFGYEGQVCNGQPTGETSWRTALFSGGCTRLLFDGLTPGQFYSFRLRALGREGWGAWSNVGQLMAV